MVVQKLAEVELEIPSKKANHSRPQPAGDVVLKTIQLTEGDSSKTVIIGSQLDPK